MKKKATTECLVLRQEHEKVCLAVTIFSIEVINKVDRTDKNSTS